MTWEELLGKTRDAAELVGKKTGDFWELTKLKMALADKEKEISMTMEGIGRLVYDAQKAGEDSADLLQDAIGTVDRLEEEAEGIRRQIYAYKNVKQCPSCQAINAEDAVYCQSCGQKLAE